MASRDGVRRLAPALPETGERLAERYQEGT
jgi:hypothetical protein